MYVNEIPIDDLTLFGDESPPAEAVNYPDEQYCPVTETTCCCLDGIECKHPEGWCEGRRVAAKF